MGKTDHLGTLVQWNDERGFGFLDPGTGPRVFAHIGEFKAAGRPRTGQRYRYTREVTGEGKIRAANIRATGFQLPRAWFAGLICLSAIAAVFSLAEAALANAYSGWWYLTVSGLSFAIFALDKYKATRDYSRISEAQLLLLTLAGGWPGALLARHLFRHKTRKQPFRTLFWLCVIANTALFSLLFTLPGEQLLNDLLAHLANST
ncbi:DUF1294 domain-containing protein [Gilvimarinus algae]|uniref:DUF1294 domain-containing protein n=1 Tax=Gilvimarinus algae TaxID=3058037 RepID=A0ABT8TAW8_9GAMM|nr:DUF1294 domain-containing protein [Gilvimarinus sp. SDUM040014]MDO3381254.1 DUF1294 domain-containing protein [Gilvimarinus sp. SDUM040014]